MELSEWSLFVMAACSGLSFLKPTCGVQPDPVFTGFRRTTLRRSGRATASSQELPT